MITPDYYEQFSCLGGECKDNCCTGMWDIEIDDEALERFQKIGGDFGELVLKSVSDDNVFIRKDGKCPLLSDDGLCRMVKEGHKLCIVCDEYPRFSESYGDYTERGISISCEEAARIVLGNKSRVKLVGSSGKCDDEMFPMLFGARNDILDILQNRDADILKRIRLVMDYGEYLQNRINHNDFEIISYNPQDISTHTVSTKPVTEFLKTLDFLDDGWGKILDNAHDTICVKDSVMIEQLAVYFVYRYFLKSLFDCDAISKLKFMAISVIAVLTLSDACDGIYESARRYSVEIEHSEDNIELIYDEFLFNDDFSTENLINMIR